MFKNQRKIALYLLSFITIEVFTIPYMLRYFWIDRADDITYLGESLYIRNTGAIDSLNIYPASHVICSILSLITTYNINIVSYLFLIYIFFLFIIGMILLSKIFIDKAEVQNILLVSSFIFYFSRFHFSIAPNYIFFAILPYYFYIIYSRINVKNPSISICLVFLLLLSPFTHPFIISFLLFFIGILLFSNFLFKLKFNNLNTCFFLLITSFLFWFITNEGYSKDLRIIYNKYLLSLTETTLMKTDSFLSRIDLSAFNFFKLLNVYYGRYYIPLLFIIIAAYILYKNKKNYDQNILRNYFILSAFFFISFVFQIFLFSNNLVPHQPDRFTSLNFTVFAQIPLFAYSLYIILLKKYPSKMSICLIALILTLVWSLSLFGCFNSPYIYQPNAALTYNEIDGMAWFYGTKANYSVSSPISQVNRYHDLFGELWYKDPIIILPDHFGYNAQTKRFSQINLNQNQHAYLIITSLDEFVYQRVPGFMRVGRYNKRDFEVLSDDPSVNKFYDSLNLDIYFI